MGTHFQEIVFVSNNTRAEGYETLFTTNPFANVSEGILELQKKMSRRWVNFVVGGKPQVAGGI